MALAFFCPAAQVQAGTRLEQIRARGHLLCGVADDSPGFAQRMADGSFVGFEVDLCRAIAAATLGSGAAVQFIAVQTLQDMQANPAIDLVFHRLSWTLQREAPGALEFGPVVLYDALGFLLDRRRATSLRALRHQRLCVAPARSLELQVFLSQQPLHATTVETELPLSTNALRTLHCAAWVGERTALAQQRLQLDQPQRYQVSVHSFGKEPLAPLLRSDDVDFSRIVRWTFMALLEAEEQHRTQSAAQRSATPTDWYDPASGAALGLAPDWAHQAVATVGHYGEIYDRHLGPASALQLPRGVNRLWTQGGLLYALPMRR